MNALSEAGDDKAKVEVARAMLEVIDNYVRAFGNITPETDAEKEIESKYKNTFDMIMKAFNELGIEEVETVGTEFNYEVHNAVMSQPSEEYEEGFVIQEFQKGYLLGEECIRPASVIVAA
jgi:molecular chaperone GrpE